MRPIIAQTGNNYILHGFSGLEEYRKFVREQSEVLNQNNREIFKEYSSDTYLETYAKTGWFGKGVTVEEMKSHITQFKNPSLIESVYEKVKNKIPESVYNKMSDHKMRFNDLFGVFSMDRFMMSMYKRPAYWSPSRKQYFPPNEVFEKKGKFFLVFDNSEVEYQEKIVSNNKNVFAHFPEIPSDSKVIEVVIVAGANSNISAEEMLYTGITGIMLAELCEKAGIKVSINLMVGSLHMGKNIAALVPVKNFQSPIDRNVMALLSSDARIFRKDMFSGIVANADYVRHDIDYTLGSLIQEAQAQSAINEMIGKPGCPFKTKRPFVTSGIFNEEAAIKKLEQVLTLLTENK